ncbi:MAG: hypothetical protein CMN98_07355 [Synechococcus sp. NP17]|nr:hypothetical protein [Synechococcus sp. NP17]|tara:strand:+ start:342 stop:536 length:195 start_codon:yes stop_codon:yes gene_type:complete
MSKRKLARQKSSYCSEFFACVPAIDTVTQERYRFCLGLTVASWREISTQKAIQKIKSIIPKRDA